MDTALLRTYSYHFSARAITLKRASTTLPPTAKHTQTCQMSYSQPTNSPLYCSPRTYVVVHYAGHATIVTSAHDDHTCVDLPQGRRVRAGGPVGGCAGRGAGRDVEAKGATAVRRPSIGGRRRVQRRARARRRGWGGGPSHLLGSTCLRAGVLRDEQQPAAVVARLRPFWRAGGEGARRSGCACGNCGREGDGSWHPFVVPIG